MAENLDRIFSPLNAVDVKTLNDIAAEFKRSKNQNRRAVGVFLDRVNVFRSQGSSGVKHNSGKSRNNLSELKDLC